MTLNRREFVGAMGASIAVVGTCTFGSASARTAPPLSMPPVFDTGIERRSRSAGGFWRTYLWQKPESGCALEILRQQDNADDAMVRLSTRIEQPRDYRFDEFALGEPQHRIREHFGDSVLQEVLEEVGR